MLTLSQKKTLTFIEQFIAEHDYAPSNDEIAKGIGISSRGVAHRYVSALKEAGYITVVPNKQRNIQLVHASQQTGLPLLGKIAAGQPIQAIHQTETVDVMGSLLGENRYALKVVGNSMVDEGILDGDLVVCEHSEQARNGQIVVALVDEDVATLKRIQANKDNTISLHPANSDYLPMTYEASRIRIQGIYIGLLRLS